MERLEDSPLLHRVLPQSAADRLYTTYPMVPRNHRNGCPSCGKNRGEGVDGTVVLDGVEWECNCHDQLQRYKHYLDAGIGQTYQFLGWDSFSGDPSLAKVVRSYCDDVAGMVASGEGMVIRSKSYGTGKTLAATFAARAAVMAGIPTFMVTFPDLMSAMKSGWHDAEYDRWRRGKVESALLLVLDDVGKEQMDGEGFNNEYAVQTLDNLVRTRVQQGRATIITTNLPRVKMNGVYGPALASLLSELGADVDVEGDDFRPMVRPPMVGRRRVW